MACPYIYQRWGSHELKYFVSNENLGKNDENKYYIHIDRVWLLLLIKNIYLFVQYYVNTIINKQKYIFVQITHIHILYLCVSVCLYLNTSVCVYYFDILCFEVTVSVFTHFSQSFSCFIVEM